jgi:hypothetical protein
MARMLAQLEAKKRWAAQHPALAAAWDEALEEDERRTREGELEAARARADLDMPHLLGKLGVGMVHREALRHPHLLEQRPSLRAARRYLGQRKPYPLPVLFLCGPAASGKTQAAVFVLAAWARQHSWNTRPSGADERLAIYTRAVDVATVDRFSTEGRGWLEQLRTSPLVVLDDIGTECATGPGAAVLYDVVDERYRQGRRTVVTSNLRGEQLRATYDERLLRRLRESSVALIETKGKPELFEGGKKSAWEMRP